MTMKEPGTRHLPKASLAFNGELFESWTGHCLLGKGYRAYSPLLMMFIQPDSWSPFGAGGLNAYAYCKGDPVNLADPSGHVPVLPGMWHRRTSLPAPTVHIARHSGPGVLLDLSRRATVQPSATQIASRSDRLLSVPEQQEPLNLSAGHEPGSNTGALSPVFPPVRERSPVAQPRRSLRLSKSRVRRVNQLSLENEEKLRQAIKQRSNAAVDVIVKERGGVTSFRRIMNEMMPMRNQRPHGRMPGAAFQRGDYNLLRDYALIEPLSSQDPNLRQFLQGIYPYLH
ncbi:RHS repeat-associated core domain-containing protein [Pseudomonas sp. GD04058]|uniref:RHS repeat-associated core domain-containing protein n=1 Tax=Pseudomonas sp. GD04058 TaxID=2975429 RepID=UPI00244A71F3|nr:RHS repeat-associated core domain-containing protein [Pseudomonas sp. GD04058]MDG9886537.1 RHS repeat-associated core domain-containing protein [Pseudomonas sp. GD04058]